MLVASGTENLTMGICEIQTVLGNIVFHYYRPCVVWECSWSSEILHTSGHLICMISMIYSYYSS